MSKKLSSQTSTSSLPDVGRAAHPDTASGGGKGGDAIAKALNQASSWAKLAQTDDDEATQSSDAMGSQVRLA